MGSYHPIQTERQIGPKPTLGSLGFSENCPHWSTVPLLIIFSLFLLYPILKEDVSLITQSGHFLAARLGGCPSAHPAPELASSTSIPVVLPPLSFFSRQRQRHQTSDKSHSSWTAVHPFLLSCPLFCSFLPFNAFPLFSYICTKTKTKTKTRQRQRQRQKDIDKGHSSCTSSWWLLPTLEWRLPTGWQYIHSCSPFKNTKVQNTTIIFFKWPCFTLFMKTKWVKQVGPTTFCFHFLFFAPLSGLNDLFRLFSNHILYPTRLMSRPQRSQEF